MMLQCSTRLLRLSASDVRGTEQYANGLTGVGPYQVGSYGSTWSCLRSKFICSMKGPDGALAMEEDQVPQDWLAVRA